MIRVGFHLEGETDDAVLRILLARLLQVEPNALEVELNLVRPRGIGQLFASLPKAVEKFWHLRARAVLVGVDNDGERLAESEDPSHPRHWLHQAPHERCRYCRCLAVTERARGRLPRAQWTDARAWPILVSVPVEALEAWLLEEAQHAGRRPFRPAESLPKSQLKMRLYGRPRPTADDIRAIAIPIAEKADLDSLRGRSRSFGLFAAKVLECREGILGLSRRS